MIGRGTLVVTFKFFLVKVKIYVEIRPGSLWLKVETGWCKFPKSLYTVEQQKRTLLVCYVSVSFIRNVEMNKCVPYGSSFTRWLKNVNGDILSSDGLVIYMYEWIFSANKRMYIERWFFEIGKYAGYFFFVRCVNVFGMEGYRLYSLKYLYKKSE